MSSLNSALQNEYNAALDAYNTQQRLIANGAFVPADQILPNPTTIKKGGKFRRNSYKKRDSRRMKKRKSRKYRR